MGRGGERIGLRGRVHGWREQLGNRDRDRSLGGDHRSGLRHGRDLSGSCAGDRLLHRFGVERFEDVQRLPYGHQQRRRHFG